MDAQPNGELVPKGGGDAIPLTRSPLLLGRRESCDVSLQFANVSGSHCELTFVKGLWVVKDLHSTNGLKVNDFRVEGGCKKVLHNGDLVTIGNRNFTINYVETGRASDLAEFEEELEDVFNTPLLEKAGLTHEPRYPKTPESPPPAE